MTTLQTYKKPSLGHIYYYFYHEPINIEIKIDFSTLYIIVA